jgi:hypothetical protein
MNDSERTVRQQGLPPEVLTRFTLAESRLYPMAMTDPEGYEHAVRLVGLAADVLRRECPDVDSVLRRRDELVTRLPELAEADDLSLRGLPADVLVDAACALRCREVPATHP